MHCQAQVYTGVSEAGSLVLSSTADETANQLLLEAEKMPLPPVAPASAGMGLANAVPAGFMTYIKEASAAYQLPSELIHAVILVESNYNPRAVSPKGARGLMQLMPATARRFGLGNSLDPRQNILAGSKYLRWLLDYFEQDLELTLAAYNAGEAAVMQAGRRLPHYGETEKYVPKVLSVYRQVKSQT